MNPYTVDENTTFIEERGHKFNILTPYDRLDIVRMLKKRKRDQLIANLDAGKVEGEQRFAELEAFEERWNDEQEFIQYVNSIEADVDIAERALDPEKKAQAKEIVSSLRLPQGRMLAFKAALTGLELVRERKSQEGEGSSPNPQTPPQVYGG